MIESKSVTIKNKQLNHNAVIFSLLALLVICILTVLTANYLDLNHSIISRIV